MMGCMMMLMDKWCWRRMNERGISARTIIRERKFKRLKKKK